MNKFYNLYSTRETRGSIPRVILQWSMVFNPLGDIQSGKDVGNNSTCRAVRTWHILAQVIT